VSDAGEVLAGIALGYLIGTFPSADLVTRLATRGRVDIRRAGSGNPGGLNSMRVLGRSWGVVVILLDTAKGAIAGFAGLAVGDPAAYAAGTAAIAGHVWPVWSRFRGGRGVATAGGSFASVFPPFFAIGAVAAGLTALLTRDPALTVKVVCPLWIVAAIGWWAADLDNWWGPVPSAGLLVYSVLGSVMVLAKFRSSARSGAPSL
jgi:glycerol-3-phosphate acyltransferase PlsY